MEISLTVALGVTGLSLAAWIWLVLGRGMFWKMDQTLRISSSRIPSSGDGDGDQIQTNGGDGWPPVRIIVPARNEADALPITLPSLLNQDYPGPVTVYLVDDESTDGTGELAIDLGREHGASQRLTVLQGVPMPPGRTGKVWALEQGVRADSGPAEFFLFTDADISHPPQSLRYLVSKALLDDLDLVSIMVRLQVSITWERLLIPAFVYFLAKLYPFRWVNDPNRTTAGAAGGCVLLRCDALSRAGGLEKISGEIIDDCALAGLFKKFRRPGGGRIWLGLAHDLRSLRSNSSLREIWGMVARTAYAQLRHSPAMLPVTGSGDGFNVPGSRGRRYWRSCGGHSRSGFSIGPLASGDLIFGLGPHGGELPVGPQTLQSISPAGLHPALGRRVLHSYDYGFGQAVLARPRGKLERENLFPAAKKEPPQTALRSDYQKFAFSGPPALTFPSKRISISG